MTEEMKRCSKCGEVKPVSEFYRYWRNRDGFQSWCKACGCEYAHKYREVHREKVLEYQREYYAQNREKVLESMRIKREANREKHPAGALVVITCEACGKEFEILESVAESRYRITGTLPRFCSIECRRASMRREYLPYAPAEVVRVIVPEASE